MAHAQGRGSVLVSGGLTAELAKLPWQNESETVVWGLWNSA